MRNFKLSVHVPKTHADKVRKAIGDAGGGCAGEYSYCSFTVTGTGRFKCGETSTPHIGTPGSMECVEEECIQVCHIKEDIIYDVVKAMEVAHPYEETAYELIELFDAGQFKRSKS